MPVMEDTFSFMTVLRTLHELWLRYKDPVKTDKQWWQQWALLAFTVKSVNIFGKK